ncbi:MAG: hypothetical protein EOO14_06280 [Chitinophagaceae bacterium]|nr:MAG: hypothetical protein EOO14_06280 [Chitinophagaceae bacterium]
MQTDLTPIVQRIKNWLQENTASATQYSNFWDANAQYGFQKWHVKLHDGTVTNMIISYHANDFYTYIHQTNFPVNQK